MRSLHETLAWVLILTNGAVGVWCLAAQQWPVLRGRPVWGGVIAAQTLVFAQAVIGALLSQQPGVPLDDMHALYGFSAIIAAMIMLAVSELAKSPIAMKLAPRRNTPR